MEQKKGKITGIGVGPGDPQLLTIKALRAIEACDAAALPGEDPRETVAYKIVEQVYPQLADKELLAVPMPMTKDPVKLEASHKEGAEKIRTYLEAGKNVVFLTLGDPTVYSTYLYVHKKVLEMGYQAEIISGITSFCAVAARLNIGLVEKAQQLHVIPASYQIEEALKLEGTKVLMKAGRKMEQVKEVLQARGDEVYMIENCGMPDEKIYYGADAIPTDAGYYSLIIVKERT